MTFFLTYSLIDPFSVVTGGGGYFGYKLGCALANAGASVVLYDIHKPIWEIPNGVVCIQADVRDYDAIFAAFEGADCVFHVASYGMSGREQLHREEIETVNIHGTRFIIDACKQRNIARLIYTSTVNVVFGGLPIEDGDEETMPLCPHVDHYSRTKSIAEQMVLAANGTPLAGGGILYTCVLRPPGIYGPQEQRHLPRLAKNIERGLLSFKFGDPSAKMNWVHAENLVQAQILAAEALTPEKNYIACGTWQHWLCSVLRVGIFSSVRISLPLCRLNVLNYDNRFFPYHTQIKAHFIWVH
uniref:Short chain dehydrogenase/reductase family 42E, member 2 n=1 Tax=Aquila chrysaetos chrysaetos TaxID=223781 RepID=A0A663EMQ0_AQUCH